jgi:hypothetical protein
MKKYGSLPLTLGKKIIIIAEPDHTYRPIAIMGIPPTPVHVPYNILIMYKTFEKLGGSGDHLVADLVLTAQNEHVDKLGDRHSAMTGGESDRKEQRDNAWTTCYNDRFSNMSKVQVAANAIPDFTLAAALIKRNGYDVANVSSHTVSANVKCKPKKNFAGVIIVNVKKPDTHKAFTIELEYSIDGGDNWIRVFAAAICTREIKDIKSPASVLVRARYIIGSNDPLDWMYSKSISV